jgi:hypothetical protein
VREVEPSLRLFPAPARQLAVPDLAMAAGEAGEVDLRQRHRPRRVDLLPGLAVDLDEAGAQRLMAARDLGEGGGERRRRERPAQEPARGDVVERAAGRQAVEEPEPLLREGEGRRPLAGEGRERRQAVLRRPLPRRGHRARQRAHGGEREERLDPELHPERPAEARQQANGEERVAAEMEEALADADRAIELQHLLPDPGDHLFDGVAGCLVGIVVRGLGGRRQRPPVDLAVGRQRQRGELHEG